MLIACVWQSIIVLVAGCSQAQVNHTLSVAYSDVSRCQSCHGYASCVIIYLIFLDLINIS